MNRIPPELVEDRERALTVPCRRPPGCGAPTGQPCTRAGADGKPLVHLPAHTCRLADAGVLHAPIPLADLADPDARKASW